MIPFYIGTYTSGISQGIHRGLLDTHTGKITHLELVAQIDNPTFLTLHPSLPVLYTCTEIRHNGRREGSQVMAFSIGNDGHLSVMGGQPSGGSGPSYVSLDHQSKVLFVANYAGGSIASMPVGSDGALGPIVSQIQHMGKSVNPDRQEGPHAHCILPDPSNRFACAVDLGLDQVLVYDLGSDQATLTPKSASNLHTPPGSGPRHLAFHPDGKHAFIIHEISNTLTLASWDTTVGMLVPLHTLSTLPAGYSQESSAAEVLVHPGGNFVYGSNRGHDSIVVFAIDLKSCQLKLVEHVSSGGKMPRNFRIDPSGRFLLAANQASDSIVVFAIDSSSGKLSRVGESVTVGSPCCIKFFVP